MGLIHQNGLNENIIDMPHDQYLGYAHWHEQAPLTAFQAARYREISLYEERRSF